MLVQMASGNCTGALNYLPLLASASLNASFEPRALVPDFRGVSDAAFCPWVMDYARLSSFFFVTHFFCAHVLHVPPCGVVRQVGDDLAARHDSVGLQHAHSNRKIWARSQVSLSEHQSQLVAQLWQSDEIINCIA